MEHHLGGLGFMISIVSNIPRVSSANQMLYRIPGFALVKSANGQLKCIWRSWEWSLQGDV